MSYQYDYEYKVIDKRPNAVGTDTLVPTTMLAQGWELVMIVANRLYLKRLRKS